jgi:hypothetical protein
LKRKGAYVKEKKERGTNKEGLKRRGRRRKRK